MNTPHNISIAQSSGPLSGLGSLIDDPALIPDTKPGKKKKAGARAESFQQTLARWWRSGRNRYDNNKRFRIATWIIAGAALVGTGTGLYFALRPTPIPDYATAPMSQVLDFTFLTAEFNKLPVEQRVKLIGDLVKRVRGMGGQDSVLMAAFAAGISGKAREQLEENASRLMLDMMDNFASGYKNVPGEQKGEFIEQKVVEMVRLMSQVAGQETTQTDEEILADAKRQAERDQRFMQSGNMTGNMAGRMFTTLNNGIGSHSTPHQKARVGNFLRDMTRHLRDQDIKTGKPNPRPAPPPPPGGG
ncbi:MAG: hypothetical protein KF912_12520 [Phycisphaeraceae bacterium]|nr:hypothetical protein [Phycisphaeraceae bacterium]MBX3368128.1 hypothetical protein [Phycisphaeraceae bacterium]QYK47798.1 MAG: hypothetical protein KF838_13530 [Phycisphaeraceae bacterium]